jgi:hypothetical protein
MANYLIMQNNDGRFAGESIISPTGLELMHTAPPNLNSNYAMGWLETYDHDSRILEHNGVLSAYYADIVLLPETGDGFVVLYNVSSFASNSIAAPRIKNGLIALLENRSPTSGGGLSLRLLGGLIGLCTIIGVALATYSLLHLARWRQWAKKLPMWRLLLGILGTFAPSFILVGFPSIVTASAGRAFSYLQLFRSMPDIFTWLGLCAILGTINGVTRILLLLRGVHRVE